MTPVEGWRDEGLIKFRVHWDKALPFSVEHLATLMKYRTDLYRQGMIGQYDDGIAFGNMSQRIAGTDSFYITGSSTGGLPELGNQHFSRVDAVDIEANRLWCTGPVIASSESMTHAVLYRLSAEINAVVHVHHSQLWESLLDHVPTTPSNVAYGTPDMARSVIDLFHQGDLEHKKILVMAGHRDGVFVFGDSLDEAVKTLMHWFHKFECREGSV